MEVEIRIDGRTAVRRGSLVEKTNRAWPLQTSQAWGHCSAQESRARLGAWGVVVGFVLFPPLLVLVVSGSAGLNPIYRVLNSAPVATRRSDTPRTPEARHYTE